jgi:hypothetical protein
VNNTGGNVKIAEAGGGEFGGSSKMFGKVVESIL